MIVILIAVFSLVAADQCGLPESTQEPLDVEKLSGTWYDRRYYPTFSPEIFLCYTVEVSPGNNPNSFQISKYSNLPGKNFTVQAVGEGNTFHISAQMEPTTIGNNYTVFRTDYVSYLLAGGCSDVTTPSEPVYWVKFRTQKPGREPNEAAAAAVASIGLDIASFVKSC